MGADVEHYAATCDLRIDSTTRELQLCPAPKVKYVNYGPGQSLKILTITYADNGRSGSLLKDFKISKKG
jgi:hypothetical protein